MTVWRPALAGVTLVLIAAGAALAEGGLLKMDAATQKRLGLVTAPLVAAQHTGGTSGFARVLDAGPLALLDADIIAARAAHEASQAEAARTRTLNAEDQTVSRRVAQAAAAQARADAARLELLRRRLGLEWGQGIARLSDNARGRLVSDLSAARAALVRIDATGGVSAASRSIGLELGPDGHALATVLGPARTSDPRLQTTGALAIVRGAAAARMGAGAVLPARIETGGSANGVTLPREALVRRDGQTLAYVRHDAGTFERRVVAGGIGGPGGIFVASGFRAGEPVVIKGAAQLLAAETPVEEEE
jgi:hypothetical protein